MRTVTLHSITKDRTPSSRMVSVRLEQELYDALAVEAEAVGISISEAIRQLVKGLTEQPRTVVVDSKGNKRNNIFTGEETEPEMVRIMNIAP